MTTSKMAKLPYVCLLLALPTRVCCKAAPTLGSEKEPPLMLSKPTSYAGQTQYEGMTHRMICQLCDLLSWGLEPAGEQGLAHSR